MLQVLGLFLTIACIVYAATEEGRENKKLLDKIQKRLQRLDALEQDKTKTKMTTQNEDVDSEEDVEQWILEQQEREKNMRKNNG